MSNCSIIIPHYNGEKILLRCLKSLFKYTPDNHEIIIVDNGSSDNSTKIIETQFPKVELIYNKTNLGYAEACNIGAIKAKNNYLIFLNNDTELTEKWIEPLIKTLDDESVSSVQPKIKNLNHRDYFDYAGAAGGYLDYLVFPFTRRFLIKNVSNKYSQKKNKEKNYIEGEYEDIDEK